MSKERAMIEATRSSIRGLSGLTEEAAVLLIVDILDAVGVVGSSNRDRVLQTAAREFAMGDYVPGNPLAY